MLPHEQKTITDRGTWLGKIAEQAAKWAQMTYTRHVPKQNGSHDVQNGHMDLQNRDVDLEQWLGQVDPRKPVHCGM